ncbi:MAG: tetratricopeptide repeat protein [Anaerolineales bacterium]|nr:tetratricopeptide repeat protein [Anaerolineales bacterium]
MEEQKGTTWIIIVSALLAVGVGYYIFTDLWDNTEAVDSGASSAEVDLGEFIDIEPVDDTNGHTISVPSPDLDREVSFPAHIPEDVREILAKDITDISNALRDNPNEFSLWIDLGINRKIVEDYEGARQAWEYASLINPTNNISFANLGDLYGYYLKDNQKAKENYGRAIENGPSSIWIYFNTASFYRDIGDLETARSIVEQGIEWNPDVEELKELLESLV